MSINNICLSPTPNLRCQSLSALESVLVLIPPGLEIIFCLSLVVIKRGSGKAHYLLASEGVIYFALALLDLVAHLLPVVRNSLAVFKFIDILIGASSSIPLLLFTLYLYMFTTRELLATLPNRLQRVTKYTLLLCIPFILASNELGSFLGLIYRMLQVPRTIEVKFTDETITVFFNSLALVVFTVFQAIAFTICFYRLVRVMVNQKRIDDTVNGNDQEAHLFNGMGWITAGIKLGVIETVVGFAPAVFGEAITRRVLRFLGRAMLIIGVIKGVDTVEDFSMFNTRERPIPRHSALLALIANPRNSSFRQIGGYDFESSMAPPAAVARSRPISEVPPSPPLLIRPPSAYKPSTPVLTVDTRNASPAKTSRVIVRYGHGRAPTLDLRRISDLSIPSPLTLYDPKSVPGSLFDTDEEKSSYFPGSMSTPNLLDASSTALVNSYSPVFPIPTPERGRRRPSTRRTYSEGVRDFRRNARRSSSVLPRPSFGSYSGASENMDVLHALAMQFPGLPPRMPASSSVQPSALDTPMQDDTDIWSPGLSRSTSGRSLSSSSGLVRRSSSVKRKPVPGYLNFENDRLSRLALSRPGSVASKTTTLVQEIPVPPLPSSLPTVTNSITFTTRSSMSYTRPRRYTESEVVTNKRSSKLEFPWLEGAGDIAAEGQAELDAAWMKIGFSRIKSVGSVPRRSTPTPSRSTFSRDSIAAEWYNSAV